MVNRHKNASPHRPKGAARDSDSKRGHNAARTVTGWRLWLFRSIAAVVLPALLLGLVELVLRLGHYGYPPQAISTCEIDGTRHACDNPQFSRRFFPHHLAREAAPYAFPAVKPEGTCRIFILGASAAMGVPEPMFSFGRMLEVMLTERYPDVRFKVVTTAMAAINSHVVVPIAKDAARYEPDVFVVYLGNNEVTGPYGAGTVFAPLSGNRALIRTSIAVKGTRLGQLMGNIPGSVASQSAPPLMWRGLEMFRDRQIRADDPALQTVYGHFRRNLETIVQTGRQSGTQVVLCTVGSNLKDSPPFGSRHRADLSDTDQQQWEAIYERGVAHEQAGRHDEAVSEYLAAAEIDETYADLQFRLGRCYDALGQHDRAAERYVRARELDTLRFRADRHINEVIRQVAQRQGEGVHLADTVAMLAEHSPDRAPGDALFYEHVHLNFTGNYLLARLVLEQMDSALPPHVRQKRSEPSVPLTEEQVAQRLAYTIWDRHKIANKILNDFIKRPPFSNRLYHEELVAHLEQELARLKTQVTTAALAQAAQRHLQAIATAPDDWVLHWKYGQLIVEASRNPQPAVEQFRWVQQHLPHSWLAYNSLAGALYAGGDVDGAIAQYRKTVQIQPTCGRAHFFLGQALQNKNRIDEAMKHYAEAMRWTPDCLPAYTHTARILAQRGEQERAIAVCRRGLIFCPDSATLHTNLGTLLARQGQRDKAIAEFRAALAIDPNLAPAAQSLQLLLKANQ